MTHSVIQGKKWHLFTHSFTHLRHWSGSWHWRWSWHQHHQVSCCAWSCTPAGSLCWAWWSSKTTCRKWHTVQPHLPKSHVAADNKGTACRTEVGSNLCPDLPAPQHHKVTSRPGTYSQKLIASGWPCSWPPFSWNNDWENRWPPVQWLYTLTKTFWWCWISTHLSHLPVIR